MHCRTDPKVESSEACRRMCQLYPNCVAWTWIEPTYTLHTPIRKNCVPKHAIGNKIKRAGVISGGRECISRGMEFFYHIFEEKDAIESLSMIILLLIRLEHFDI